MQVSENPGSIKESHNFSDFFPLFLFSHKLNKRLMKVIVNSLVIMPSNIHTSLQLPITDCLGCTEVHLFQSQRVGRG